jgi:hypothetical protein
MDNPYRVVRCCFLTPPRPPLQARQQLVAAAAGAFEARAADALWAAADGACSHGRVLSLRAHLH